MEVRNLTVIKVAALGDIIMMLPSVRAYKRLYPKSIVTVCVGKSSAAFLSYYPEIDKVVLLDENRILKGSLTSRLLEFLRLWRLVGFQKNTDFFIGHSDPRYSLLLPFRRHKRFVPIRGKHHITEYIRHVISQDYSFEICEAKQTVAVTDVILAPGGAKNLMSDDFLRRWPLENYVTLARALLFLGVEVSLIGSETDLWVLDSFKGLKVKSYIGNFKLEETLDVLSKSKLLITHDSGPMHFGNLVGIPVISIFGPTDGNEKLPLSNKLSFHYQGGTKLSCSPCYDGKRYADCERAICMEEVTSEMVLNKATEILRARES